MNTFSGIIVDRAFVKHVGMTCFLLIIGFFVQAQVSITGPTEVCISSTGVSYSATAGSGTYTWTITGGSITSGQGTNSIFVTWNSTPGPGNIGVEASGGSQSGNASLSVTKNDRPVPTITGTTSICPNSSGIVYFTESGMIGYTWTISSGGTITDGWGTNAITVTWNTSGSQTITVNYSNASGCNALTPSSRSITVFPTPTPTITGAATACTGSTVFYTTESGMTNYQWVVSSGGTIVSGSGTNAISVIWNTAGSKTVSVSYINTYGCATLVPTVKNVIVNLSPTPTITGTDTVCLNGTLSYATESGMALYSWTLGTGGIILLGQGTNIISVKWTQSGTKLVSVSYTNTSNCTATANKTITVYSPPVPVITGPSSACTGANAEFSTAAGMTNYSWSVSSGGSISSGSGTNTIIATWNNAGQQSVFVSYTDIHGCAALNPTQFNFTINARPATPVITGPSVACAGTTNNSYSTLAGMTSYSWTISSGGTIITNPSTHASTIIVAWNTVGAQTVGVNYTSIAGCQALSDASYPVVVNAQPVPTLIGPASVCINSANNVYSTESGMSNYSWTVSVGGVVTAGGTSTSNTVTITWTTAGTKLVTVNYANATGCLASSPAAQAVTVNPLPLPTITGASSACINSTGNLYTTEAGMNGYTWQVTGGTIVGSSSTNVISVTWNTLGAQSISVNYNNVNSCTAASATMKNVTVNALPSPTITGPSAACINSAGSTFTTETGMTGYTWSVTGGTIVGPANTNIALITWNTLGVQTVTVTYTNVNGCVAPAPVVKTVTVHAPSAPTISGSNTACAGNTVIYTTESGMTNYLWTISSGGFIVGASNTNSVSVIWNVPGSGTISVIYTDLNGCTQTAPSVMNISVGVSPVPTITGTTSICPGSSGIVYFTEAGMINYIWTISSGGTITQGSGTNVITVTWQSSGPQVITVNYTSLLGCSAGIPTSKAVTVLPTPTPTITGLSTVCSGSVENYNTEAGMTNYQWSLSSGGTIVSGNNTNAITVNWNTVGTHFINVSYINTYGCPTVVPTVKYVLVNPSPIPTITGADTVCLNGTINYITESGQTLYQWTVSSGGIITSGAGTNSVWVKWVLAGNRTISINYTNISGCSSIVPIVKNISVFPLPVPAISGPATSCTGATGVEYSSAPGMSNYVWNVSSGGTIIAGSGTNIITVNWNAVGNQSVSVNYTNLLGCSAAASTSYPVVVHPVPTPTITGTVNSCMGTTGVAYTTETGMLSYLWTISSGGVITAGSGTNNITVNWIEEGAQNLTVNYTTSFGCTATTPTLANITVHPLPVPTISGSDFVCINQTSTHSTESGMTGYQWTVSSGGTIVSGGGTHSIVVQWATTGQKTISVNYTSPVGCTAAAPSTKTIMVSALPVPVITGNSSACQGVPGITYTTETGMTNYLWTISSGGTITSGLGTNVITVTWNSLGNQEVSVNYTNIYGCSATNSTNFTVTVNPTVIPTITGPNQVCANSGNYTYSTEQGMQNYSWTVTSGGIIVGGTGTSSIQVLWTAAGSQTVGVMYSSPAGCTTAPTTLNVTVKSLPEAHGPISGDTLVCKPQSGVIYSISPIPNAQGYLWNVPVFANITSGANTNIITVDFGSTTQSGNISVFGTNSCGNGPNTPLLPVAVHPIPVTPHVTVYPPDTLRSSASTGNQWYREYVPIAGATDPIYIVTQIGRYFVITTQNACVSDTSNVIYMFPVGIVEGEDLMLKVFPNPASDKITLTLNTGGHHEILSVILVNNLGLESQILADCQVNGAFNRMLNLGDRPSGIYSLVVQVGNRKMIRKLIIIND